MTVALDFVSKSGVHADTATIVDIVQGTGETNRIGRKCTITNIHIKMHIEHRPLNGTTTAEVANFTDCLLRVVVFLDRQCNGAAATGLNLLQTDVLTSFRSLANVKRFKFLYDKTWSFNTQAMAAGTVADTRIIDKTYFKKISLKCFIPIEYSGTTGAITEIRSNNIGIAVWSAPGSRINIENSQIRLRFIDY